MMGLSGSFPVDLIFYGMIAAFLVLRLRGILGRRTGFERPPQANPATPPRPAVGSAADGQAGSGEPVAASVEPDASSALGQTLAQMQEIDRNFNAGGFLKGAEQAFRIIVGAFAASDRARLRPLLADDIYAAFDQAIADREKREYSQISEIRAIQSKAIDAAELRGTIGILTVAIVSDQISLTKDKVGQPVMGAEAVTEIRDLWTFERDLAQPDPAWRLVAARSA